MKSEQDMHKLVKRLHLKASSSLGQRVHGDIDKALAGVQIRTDPEIGRRIMIGSIAKLTVAAAVILTVLLGLNVIDVPGASGIAWAQIPDRIAKIDTFIFSLTIRVTDSEGADPLEGTAAQWIFYLSEEYGFRMDMGGDGSFVSYYVAPEADTMIAVVPGKKTWFESPVPEDRRMPDEYKDPADYIRRFLARPRRELGRSVIDGIQVEGIEVTDPPTDGEKLENGIGRMWVDVETELPVRIEIEGTAESHTAQWLLDFKWSEMVDPAVFEPNIPPDYTSPLR
jgi:outer membrane lipoprotein-sorting protein